MGPVKLSATTQKVLIAQAQNLAAEWDSMSSGQKIDLIKRFIRNVIVSQVQVLITISTTNLVAELLNDDAKAVDPNGDPLSLEDHLITLPVHLKRCGIETKLVVPNESRTATLAPRHYYSRDPAGDGQSPELESGTSGRICAVHDGTRQPKTMSPSVISPTSSNWLSWPRILSKRYYEVTCLGIFLSIN